MLVSFTKQNEKKIKKKIQSSFGFGLKINLCRFWKKISHTSMGPSVRYNQGQIPMFRGPRLIQAAGPPSFFYLF